MNPYNPQNPWVCNINVFPQSPPRDEDQLALPPPTQAPGNGYPYRQVRLLSYPLLKSRFSSVVA